MGETWLCANHALMVAPAVALATKPQRKAGGLGGFPHERSWEWRFDLAPLWRFEVAPPPSDWLLTV